MKYNFCLVVNQKGVFLIAEIGGADLSSARFVDAGLSGAKVRGTDLTESVFVRTKVEGTDFGYSRVYGISIRDLAVEISDETNLLVTPPGERHLRTDSPELASERTWKFRVHSYDLRLVCKGKTKLPQARVLL